MPPAHLFNRRTIGHCMGTFPTFLFLIIIINNNNNNNNNECRASHYSPRIFVAEAVRQRPGFDPRPVRVRFVALGQVSCRLLQFTPVSVIPCLPYSASGLINYVWCGQFWADFGLGESKYIEWRMNKYTHSYIKCIIVSVYCTIHHMD
jgi:hypothetical protein